MIVRYNFQHAVSNDSMYVQHNLPDNIVESDFLIELTGRYNKAVTRVELNMYTPGTGGFMGSPAKNDRKEVTEGLGQPVVSFKWGDYYDYTASTLYIKVTIGDPIPQADPITYVEDLTGITSDVSDMNDVTVETNITLSATQAEYREYRIGEVELLTDLGNHTLYDFRATKTGTFKPSDKVDPNISELTVRATAERYRAWAEVQLINELTHVDVETTGYLDDSSRPNEPYYASTDLHIKLTPEPHHRFTDVTLNFENMYGNVISSYQFTDVKEAEFIEFEADDYFIYIREGRYKLRVVANAELALDTFPYTETLKLSTSDMVLDYVTEMTEVTYTAIEDHELTDVTVTVDGSDDITYTPELFPHKFTAGAKSFKLQVEPFITDTFKSLHVTVNAKKIEKFRLHLIEVKDVTVKVGDTVISEVDEEVTVDISDNIVIKAVGELVFNDPITLDVRRSVGDNETIKYYPEESEYFNDTKNALILPARLIYDDDIWIVRVTALASERRLDTGILTSFANVYKVDATTLDKLSRERFGNIMDGEPVDYGDYIHNLYTTPITLPSELISEEGTPITLGQRKTEVEAPIVLGNKVLYDLGTIEVNGAYGNVYDYRETEALLHIPYATQPISVPIEYVIDEVISLTLALDLFNGTATLNVYSSKTDNGLVSRNDIQLTHAVPFMRARRDTVRSEIGRYIHNHVETPYIELKRSIPYDAEAFFGKASNDYALLGDFSGYVEVRDLNMDTSATTTEQAEIQRRLTQGTVINVDEPDTTD